MSIPLIWHLYPWSLISALVVCTIALHIALKAWQRRPVVGTVPTFLLMLTITLWSIIACVEDASGNLDLKLACFDIQVICYAVAPILWLTMVLDYLGYQHLLNWRNLVRISVVPLCGVLLCWTNASHGLLYSRASLDVFSGIPYLLLEYSTGFWVFTGYAYLLVLFGTIICLLYALSSVGVHRWQAILLLFGGLFPGIVSVLDCTYTILPAWNLTPMAFLVTGATMVWGLRQFHLWEITPVAYQTMFRSMADGVLVIDARNYIVEINPAGSAILNLNPEEIIGQPVQAIFPQLPGLAEEYFANEDKQLISDMPGETRAVYDIRITPLRAVAQPCSGWLVVMRDISELRKLEHQLYALAYYDGLTGLPNRLLLRDRIAHTLKRGRRNKTLTGIMFVDLDCFKHINDTHGHAMGDEVLQQVAGRLQNAVRESDTVVRFGGDEFVLIIPDLQNREALIETSQRVQEAFSPPFTLKDRSFTLTLSIGLVIAPMDGSTADVLLKKADLAMYQAKASGGSHHAFYPSLQLTRE